MSEYMGGIAECFFGNVLGTHMKYDRKDSLAIENLIYKMSGVLSY